MSNFRKIQIQCPKCKKYGTYVVWDSINNQVNPELVDNIKNLTLYDWNCESCGCLSYIAYGFLYHDMNNHYMISVDVDYQEEVDKMGLPDCYQYIKLKDIEELKIFIESL
jgi:hypothetical protein